MGPDLRRNSDLFAEPVKGSFGLDGEFSVRLTSQGDLEYARTPRTAASCWRNVPVDAFDAVQEDGSLDISGEFGPDDASRIVRVQGAADFGEGFFQPTGFFYLPDNNKNGNGKMIGMATTRRIPSSICGFPGVRPQFPAVPLFSGIMRRCNPFHKFRPFAPSLGGGSHKAGHQVR